MKNLQTQKNKRDFSKPQKIRISKISDPKISRAPMSIFFKYTPWDIQTGTSGAFFWGGGERFECRQFVFVWLLVTAAVFPPVVK